MNTDIILFNLREAQGELRSMITAFEQSPDTSFDDFHVTIAHLYHHLNPAWNARNATRERWEAQIEKDYKLWESFPRDLPLMGSDTFFDLPEYRKPST